MKCGLCSPTLGPVLTESALWRLILNRNQNLLGKCFLVTRRHVESVEELTASEWNELREQLHRAIAMLRHVTLPDHFNYAFLQNRDRHVHLHVIPRYAAPRRMFGLTFEDPDYPSHYAVPTPDRHLTQKQVAQLVALFAGAV